jgi:hypothetical protein
MEILKAIDKVLQGLVALRQELASEIEKHDVAMGRVAEREKVLAEATGALELRELEVKKIEDIVALEQSANELMRQAKAEKSEALSIKAKIDEDTVRERKAIALLRQEVNDDLTIIKKDYDILHSQQAAFVKEKEDWKQKLAANLVKNADR